MMCIETNLDYITIQNSKVKISIYKVPPKICETYYKNSLYHRLVSRILSETHKNQYLNLDLISLISFNNKIIQLHILPFKAAFQSYVGLHNRTKMAAHNIIVLLIVTLI